MIKELKKLLLEAIWFGQLGDNKKTRSLSLKTRNEGKSENMKLLTI